MEYVSTWIKIPFEFTIWLASFHRVTRLTFQWNVYNCTSCRSWSFRRSPLFSRQTVRKLVIRVDIHWIASRNRWPSPLTINSIKRSLFPVSLADCQNCAIPSKFNLSKCARNVTRKEAIFIPRIVIEFFKLSVLGIQIIYPIYRTCKHHFFVINIENDSISRYDIRYTIKCIFQGLNFYPIDVLYRSNIKLYVGLIQNILITWLNFSSTYDDHRLKMSTTRIDSKLLPLLYLSSRSQEISDR